MLFTDAFEVELWDVLDTSALPLALLRSLHVADGLHCAVAHRDIKEVERLLNAGADPQDSCRAIDGLTPLHIAATLGPSSLIELLLKAGAGVDIIDAYGRTPLHLASRASSFETIYTHIVQSDQDGPNGNFKPRYVSFKHNGDDDVEKRILLLVSAGADIGARDKKGRTPLFHALLGITDSLAPVETLLRIGANVHSSFTPGRPLLHDLPHIERMLYRFTGPHPPNGIPQTIRSVLALLLREGADVGARDVDNLAPLHHAVVLGCEASVAAFLELGAHPNACSNGGDTPLHLAVRSETVSLPIYTLLLETGADPTRRNAEGSTPISIAVDLGLKYVIECILVHSLEQNSVRQLLIFNSCSA